MNDLAPGKADSSSYQPAQKYPKWSEGEMLQYWERQPMPQDFVGRRTGSTGGNGASNPARPTSSPGVNPKDATSSPESYIRMEDTERTTTAQGSTSSSSRRRISPRTSPPTTSPPGSSRASPPRTPPPRTQHSSHPNSSSRRSPPKTPPPRTIHRKTGISLLLSIQNKAINQYILKNIEMNASFWPDLQTRTIQVKDFFREFGMDPASETSTNSVAIAGENSSQLLVGLTENELEDWEGNQMFWALVACGRAQIEQRENIKCRWIVVLSIPTVTLFPWIWALETVSSKWIRVPGYMGVGIFIVTVPLIPLLPKHATPTLFLLIQAFLLGVASL